MIQHSEAPSWDVPFPVTDDDCPQWCLHEHLGGSTDPEGFHHDGAVTTVTLCSEVSGAPHDLFVNVSERIHQGEPPEGARVEIQDDWRTIALMTPSEALALGEALTAAASVAGLGADGAARQDGLEVVRLSVPSPAREA